MSRVGDYLLSQARGDLLPSAAYASAAKDFGLSYAQVEDAALETGLLPERYERNRRTISTSDQRRLFRSKVVVFGCGGLGGYIIEELARLGVGRITVVDPDVFVEHNLNRQLFSSSEVVGKAKVEVAESRIKDINPAVTVTPVKEAFCASNGGLLLNGADVAADALDNIPLRLQLADTCGAVGVPLVHGAIAGWYGQIITQFPGENTVQKIYGNPVKAMGIEKELGNPSFTPAVIASLEVAEVCKILLGRGKFLRQRMLFVNLLDMEVEEVNL